MPSCQCVPIGANEQCGRTRDLLEVRSASGNTMYCCLVHLDLTISRMADFDRADPVEPRKDK